MKNKIKLCKDCKYYCPSNNHKIDELAKCGHPALLEYVKASLVTGKTKEDIDRRRSCMTNRSRYGGGGYFLWKWGCGPRGNLWEAK